MVLAGGRGRRVHGQDKGLLSYQGRPLIATILERLEPQVGSILISANRNLDQYQSFGWPVFQDRLDNYQGPLAGLCSGLEAARTPWLLSVPCDGPVFPLNLVERLAAALENQPASVALACDGIKTHYTYALLSTRLLDDLHSTLARGERRLGTWLEAHQPALADFSASAHSSTDAFANLNHPEDFV